ncbi:hypothetical protein D3C81_1572750 [compost metagenome]
MTVIEAAQFTAPPVQPLVGHASIVALVDDGLHLAAEGVQRRDGVAAFGREEQEAVIGEGAAWGGLVLAILIGRHANLL